MEESILKLDTLWHTASIGGSNNMIPSQLTSECQLKHLPLSLKIVHNSPPRQVSISMYKYFLSLNVLYNFTINSQFISDIISFSDMMCCCCLVSTIWAFFICFRAKDLVGSPWIWTSSTRPKPPIPNVAMMRRSERRRLANSSLSLKNTKQLFYFYHHRLSK